MDDPLNEYFLYSFTADGRPLATQFVPVPGFF